MRPLMVPDPVCASCRGTFVEKMENPEDDPREFARSNVDNPGADSLPPGIDTFLLSLQNLMDRGMEQPSRPRSDRTNNAATGSRITFTMGGPGGAVFTLGGANTLEPRTPDQRGNNVGNQAPTIFLRPTGNERMGGSIPGPVMAHYLMSLLGQQDPVASLFAGGLGGSLPENGRMGDYVFNQEALDQIVTQLMENSNAHRPVPATEEVIKDLSREVLMEKSPTLEKDCAVCKEQFALATEDPDEQVVITLPCSHPFHAPCILPWLKTSGTCPVCRYALVPQPEQHTPTSPNPSRSPRGPSPYPSSRSSNRESEPGGLFQSIFGGLNQGNNASRNSSSSARPSRSNSEPGRRSSGSSPNSGNHLPGSWNDDLD